MKNCTCARVSRCVKVEHSGQAECLLSRALGRSQGRSVGHKHRLHRIKSPRYLFSLTGQPSKQAHRVGNRKQAECSCYLEVLGGPIGTFWLDIRPMLSAIRLDWKLKTGRMLSLGLMGGPIGSVVINTVHTVTVSPWTGPSRRINRKIKISWTGFGGKRGGLSLRKFSASWFQIILKPL